MCCEIMPLEWVVMFVFVFSFVNYFWKKPIADVLSSSLHFLVHAVNMTSKYKSHDILNILIKAKISLDLD